MKRRLYYWHEVVVVAAAVGSVAPVESIQNARAGLLVNTPYIPYAVTLPVDPTAPAVPLVLTLMIILPLFDLASFTRAFIFARLVPTDVVAPIAFVEFAVAKYKSG